jgi:hypothetical protein
MGLFLGFDPGGAGAFGWCVAAGTNLPLEVVARGVGRHAEHAYESARAAAGKKVDGVGIDAPLFWRSNGDRHVDQLVRTEIIALGAKGGTVNSVNSMRGACLIQGMLIGMLVRQTLPPTTNLTESHPKAALWLLRLAFPGHPPAEIDLSQLQTYFMGNTLGATDHERDAAIGALSAFAMTTNLAGWRDLFPSEGNSLSPLQRPLGYWLPQ